MISEKIRPQIVILAAGDQDEIFENAGFNSSRFLIDIQGLPLLYKIVKECELNYTNLVIVMDEEHDLRFELSKAIKIDTRIVSSFEILTVKRTYGSLASAMMAIDHLNETDPILFLPGDIFTGSSLSEFYNHCLNGKLDVGAMSTTSYEDRWAFVKTTNGIMPSQVRTKIAISDETLVGVYFFKSKAMFEKSFEFGLTKSGASKDNFHFSQILMPAIANQLEVQIFKVTEDKVLNLASPGDYRRYQSTRIS